MSYRRLLGLSFLSAVVVAAVPAAYGAQELPPGGGQQWQIAGAFPQSAPGPLERQAQPITPENPIPRRTRTVRPPYPSEAAVVGARATVTLRVTVDHLGTVAEVRTVGAPVLGAMSPPSPAEERAFTTGLLALIRSAKDAVGQWRYEPPADAPIAFDVVIGFTSEGDGEVIAQSSGRELPEPPLKLKTETVPRVGDGIRPPTRTKHVAPIYPEAAREARVAGVVVIEARIEADGRILEARVLRSIPELDDAALEAVKQWEFSPTFVNGEAAPVIMTITVQFSLR
jgi:protein TonB